MPLNFEEKEQFCREVVDEVLGLGPIEPFMHDPAVTDILVNTHRNIYVEKYGKLHATGARFKDETHLKKIIDRIVSAVGRRIDESCPMVDARLPDGSRVNAIVPPLAIDGACLSIRRFSVEPLELAGPFYLKTLTPEIGELLKGMVQARLNVLISGGTGTGKTTLLNVLSRFIPERRAYHYYRRLAELQMKQEHVVRLETKPANIEGKGEVTQRDLVRNSLRMRPDRIIVGEVRSGEVLDMLQAMNTGHDGSLTTIHANSPRDALLRLETLVAMAGLNIPNDAVRRYTARRSTSSSRSPVLSTGAEKSFPSRRLPGWNQASSRYRNFSVFEQAGIDGDGAVKGHFRSMGVMPGFLDRFKALAYQSPTKCSMPSGLIQNLRRKR